jgi:alpha-glucosidase
VKRVYLPEGEWIDFNDKQTIYLGGQRIAYRTPLNVIPIFVKKGSIIPQMPVMQYIHEKKDYPLMVHIFPSYEGETTTFELYEDDGENLDYLKNIGSRTAFNCTTSESGWMTKIIVTDNDFRQSDKRNTVLTFHLAASPRRVEINGVAAKKINVKTLSDTVESDFVALQWAWDEATKECRVKVPDKRKDITIVVVK